MRLDQARELLAVTTPRMLYEMKRDTVRPQDKIDAERIRDTFDLDGA